MTPERRVRLLAILCFVMPFTSIRIGPLSGKRPVVTVNNVNAREVVRRRYPDESRSPLSNAISMR